MRALNSRHRSAVVITFPTFVAFNHLLVGDKWKKQEEGGKNGLLEKTGSENSICLKRHLSACLKPCADPQVEPQEVAGKRNLFICATSL